jgi:predicted small secreted protein
MKKKTLLLWMSLLVVLALGGCATIQGIGEDVQSLGRAIQRVFSG